MKSITFALAGLLVLNLSTVLSMGLRQANPGNERRLFSVTTTREVAATYGRHWNIIQEEQSQQLRDESEDLVQLQILVGDEEEVDYLEHLESAGVLSYEQVVGGELSSHTDRFLRYDQQNFTDRSNVVVMGDEPQLSCYRTVDETYASMDALAESYPDFVRVETIGQSWVKMNFDEIWSSLPMGYDIKIMVLSAPSDYTKHDIMIVGGHHSRELPPPEVAMRWAEHLLASYGKDADITWILERTNVHIVPIANPDGRHILGHHLEWWKRKNAHPYGCPNGTASDGVDLNRQYPFMWGNVGDAAHASSNPCKDTYMGPEPLSEPESRAVYEYAHKLFADEFKRGDVNVAMANLNVSCSHEASGIFIDIHSPSKSDDSVLFPYQFADLQTPNHQSLLTLASKLSKPGNYSLWGPGQAGLRYTAAGVVQDSTYGIDCIASFGFETGSQFYADCTSLNEQTIPVMFKSLLYAAKSVSAPYKIPLGPDLMDACVDNTIPKETTMTVRVSDKAMIVSHAIFEGELSQAIKNVEVFLDAHPYDNGSKGMSMEPADGAYDSTEEFATYSLDTSSWDGRHVLYFQATDTDGNTGPVSAFYVDNNEPNSCMGVVSASQ